MNARHHVLPLSFLAAVTVALAACSASNGTGPGTETTGSGPLPTVTTVPAPLPTRATAPSTTAPSTAAPVAPVTTGKSSPTRTPTGSRGGNATSDAYAYQHPCSPAQVTVKVVQDARLGATKRLIEVTNNGAASCGLSYYPGVTIIDRGGGGKVRSVQPQVPGGLGGPPAHPLYAGRTAYAVLDLNPGHATAATGTQPFSEIGVIYNTDLPHGRSLYFPLTAGGGRTGDTAVKDPFLGLYRDTITDADDSANPAGG